ncbi:AAA family ATPase, partial [Pseudomonas shirazensis]
HGMQANFRSSLFPHTPADQTILLDAPDPSWAAADSNGLKQILGELLEGDVQGRMIIIHNWSSEEQAGTWPQLRTLIKGRAHIECMINFSSLPDTDEQYTATILNTRPANQKTLYIDVSRTNKDLAALDGIERMLLAGAIYNLWQERPYHRDSNNLSSEVVRFLNSYLPYFRPINGLCASVNKRPSLMPLKTLVTRKFVLAGEIGMPPQTLSVSSGDIADRLRRQPSPACLYVIGNNGEGKSQLLRDLAYRLAGHGMRSIGVPLSHSDRFPFADPGLSGYFYYEGLRTGVNKLSLDTRIKHMSRKMKQIAGDEGKIDQLSECLGMLGFKSRFFLTLRTALNPGDPNLPSKHTLDLQDIADLDTLRSNLRRISGYELSVLREGEHRPRAFSTLSSGEQNIVSLMLKVLAAARPGATFLIDEPEISLHVSWQQVLPRILNLLADKLQVSFVVATHSPILIANTSDTDVCLRSRDRRLSEITGPERHSVETILMEGFLTYTPHNRAIQEKCAQLVASIISAVNTGGIGDKADNALGELSKLEKTIEDTGRGNQDRRERSDLDLIAKAQAAISMLLAETLSHD